MEEVLKIFSYFKKKEQVNLGYLGVCHFSRGIGFAHVIREFGQPPQLLSYDYAPCDPNRSRTKVLAEAVGRMGLGDVPCVVRMEVGSYSLLQIEKPDLSDASDWQETLRGQIKDLINYPVDEAVVDLFEVPGRGDKMAYAVVSRYEDVKKNVDLFHDSKVKLAAIDIPELAYKSLVSLLPENRWGVGFLHFGAREAVVGVVRDSTLYLARNINQDLEDLFEASMEAPLQNPDDLMPSRFDKILDRMGLEIQRTFDYYERSSAMAPIGTLIVMPSERPLFQVIPFLDGYLSADVKMLDLNAIFEGIEIPMEEQFKYALAAACALRPEQDAL